MSASAVLDGVRDARPPRVVVAMTSFVLRIILRTPVARAIPALALVSFAGRRSGRPITVVVGWHSIEGTPVVFTPASWRANFVEAHTVTVRHANRRLQLVGTLTTDPAQVAETLNAALRSGTSTTALALRCPSGHTITASDVAILDRAMIRFQPEHMAETA